jgi:hypothetical protein
MAYSYSGLKEFSTCQRKYYETRVIKIHPRQETDATRYGTEVHLALEEFVRDGKPLGPHERFYDLATSIKNMAGDKFTEMELAVDHTLNPCEFDDPNAFIRGIADVVVLNHDKTKAYCLDYKTGGHKYPDKDQLELMSLLLFRHYPELQEVKGALLFILHDKTVTEVYHRRDAKVKWVIWLNKVERIEEAHDVSVWNENPSGLCKGYCPCNTCPHWGELKKRK